MVGATRHRPPAEAGERVVFTGPLRARDGRGFQWTLHSLTCGVRPEGVLYEDESPQGEFCRADVTAVNRSNTADRPLSSHYAWSGDNAFGELDSVGEAFQRNIFPDATADGRIYFDVPRRAAVDALHLNAIDEDGGARFDLSGG